MELQEIIDCLAPIKSAEIVIHDQEYSAILLTPDEYNDACLAIDNLKLADMVNYKTAQAAFPKLVKVVKLVLALADGPVGYPGIITLSSKVRAQLLSALKVAGE